MITVFINCFQNDLNIDSILKLFLEFLVQWLISFEMSAAVNEETIFYSNPNPYEVTIVGFGTI